jgi:hypothetical protein
MLTLRKLYGLIRYQDLQEGYMSGKMIPLEIEGIKDNIYSGFWPRLGANLIDHFFSVSMRHDL